MYGFIGFIRISKEIAVRRYKFLRGKGTSGTLHGLCACAASALDTHAEDAKPVEKLRMLHACVQSFRTAIGETGYSTGFCFADGSIAAVDIGNDVLLKLCDK